MDIITGLIVDPESLDLSIYFFPKKKERRAFNEHPELI